MIKRFTLISLTSFFLLACFVSAVSFSGGPPAQKTGAPTEGNCTNCHSGSLNPTGATTSINIVGGLTEYQLNQTYTINVQIDATNPTNRFGFQLTALNSSNVAAGTFTITDAVNTSDNAFSGKSYIQHTFSGSSPSSTNQRIWTFNWKAPATDVGIVTFYASIMAANDNGGTSGDKVYSKTKSMSPVPFAITLNKFNALLRKDHIEVSWDKPFSTQNEKFALERSVDGIKYEKIYDLNSNSKFNFQDRSFGEHLSIFKKELGSKDISSNQQIYYRLSSINDGGEIDFSNIVSVNVPSEWSNQRGIELLTQPYYSKGELNFETSSVFPENFEVSLVNVLGKTIYSHNLKSISGIKKWNLPLSIAKGNYYFKISGNISGMENWQKIIIED